MSLCKFCGEEITDGKCLNDHSFKKMCINCTFSSYDEESDTYKCENEVNMANAVEAIKKAAMSATESYQIDTIDIKVSPLPLKRPTCKCKSWVLDESVKNELVNLFV